MIPERHIWIFTGGGQFPGGVFSTIERAEAWIERNRRSGMLTAYPIDQGCFDWAVENNCTNLKSEKLEGSVYRRSLLLLVCFYRTTVSADFRALVESFYGYFVVLRLRRLELHSS